MKAKGGGTRARGDTQTKISSARHYPPPTPLTKASTRQGTRESQRPSFQASKGLGQNFLIDKGTIQRFVNAVQPRPDETIVEIGPGQGALTGPLLDSSARLVAVEFFLFNVPAPTERFGSEKNFTLIESDALLTDFCGVIQPATQARVVANLPYNIATAILQRLIEQRRCLTEITLILQREVVERITAQPGSKNRSFLSVLIEAYYGTEKLFDIGPRSSRPAPKVWSSVVRLTRKPEVSVKVSYEKLFWQVISAGFAQRRKTILNNLRSAPSLLQEEIRKHSDATIVLCEAGVGLQRRAESLTLDEWLRIVKALDRQQ